MRPEIPDELEARIAAVYEDAGYTSRGAFVRDAVRRRVEEVRRHADSRHIEEAPDE